MDTLPYLIMFSAWKFGVFYAARLMGILLPGAYVGDVMVFPSDFASRTLLEIQSLWHQQFAIKTIIKDSKESCLVENCLLEITALSKIVLLFPCHKPC